EVINETSLELPVNEPKKVVAVYNLKEYSITFNTDPSGLNMTVNEQNIVTPKSISAKIGDTFSFEISELQKKNETIYIDGNDTRYSFLKWDDENTSPSREFTVSDNSSFTAFMKTEYFVDISSEMTEINETGWYEKGKQIELTAPEVDGYVFDHWIINDSETVNSVSLSLTVNKPMKIVANYKKEVQKFSLSINSSPQELTVIVDEETLLTPIIKNFKANSTHEFSMVDKQEKDISEYVTGNDTRYLFEKWNDGSTEISRTISLDSDKTFTASTKKYFKVETGTIPLGIAEIIGAGWYENNSSISVKAEDIDNYNFLHWQINGDISDEDVIKTLIVDKPISIKAVYNTFPIINLDNIAIEKDQEIQLNLNEFSSDPDNDTLSYYLVSGPGNIDQDTYSLDTSTIEAGKYDVKIKVEDGRGGVTSDSFTVTITEANNPPVVPSSPTPNDESTNQETSLTLSWQCSDPDNDSLAYDLYFGTNKDPELLEDNLTEKSFTVNSLNESTTYYWKIVAEDSNGAITEGPVWSFSTKEPPPADGVDLTGPIYSGDILLVNNESESSNKEYTGTLSENNYLPEGDYLPENLEREAYMVDPELPLPDNADTSNLAKPQDFIVASLGDTKTFWARDFSTNEDYQITATLQYSGDHCEVWAENPEEITSGKAAELGSEFDNTIYPLITEYFYSPSDVNKDGKVAILAIDIRDNFDNTGAYVGGYFYSADLFNVEHSNKMEIFYIDTYPTMHYPKTNEINVSRAFSTLAHEFQHMVNFNRNYLVEYGNPMPTWLNEGLSLAAEHLYKGVLTSRISYYNNSSNIKNGHSLLYWGDNGDTLSNYSLSYLFLQYIRTQAGSNNVFKDILLDNKNDSEAVTNALSKYGISKTFGDLMTDFRLALLIKDSNGPYGFNGDSSFSNISTQLYTGSAKDIRGGTAFFKAINGSYEDPGDSGSSIQYAGIFN
ncbi:MAG: InlB B-repeat-containing protein, partial [Kosmotogaceae bacterium]